LPRRSLWTAPVLVAGLALLAAGYLAVRVWGHYHPPSVGVSLSRAISKIEGGPVDCVHEGAVPAVGGHQDVYGCYRRAADRTSVSVGCFGKDRDGSWVDMSDRARAFDAAMGGAFNCLSP